MRVDDLPGEPPSSSSSPPGAAEEEVSALLQAGWVLVPSGTPPVPGTRAARVFLEDGSHVLLSDGALTVKFHDDISSERVQQILSRAGLRARPTPIACNAFQARVQEPDSADAVDVARSLEEQPEVEFAEPSFIETFGNR